MRGRRRIGREPRGFEIRILVIVGGIRLGRRCERVELILERKEEYLLDELAGQLNSESRKRAVMVVKTVYGDKTFYVDELKAVLIDNGVGEPEDITERITGVQNP